MIESMINSLIDVDVRVFDEFVENIEKISIEEVSIEKVSIEKVSIEKISI